MVCHISTIIRVFSPSLRYTPAKIRTVNRTHTKLFFCFWKELIFSSPFIVYMVGIGEGRGRGGREVVGNEREERWLVRGGKRDRKSGG